MIYYIFCPEIGSLVPSMFSNCIVFPSWVVRLHSRVSKNSLPFLRMLTNFVWAAALLPLTQKVMSIVPCSGLSSPRIQGTLLAK